MKRLSRAAVLTIALCLAACSGGAEPTVSDIQAALANNETMVGSVASLDLGVAVKPADVIASLLIEKGACSPAQGQAGYACEIALRGFDCDKLSKLGATRCPEMSGSAPRRARFFQSGGAWQFEPLPPEAPKETSQAASPTDGASPTPDYPAMIDDKAPGYDVADGSVLEILGIGLGMPMADATGLAQSLHPDSKPHWYDDIPSTQDEHGTVASFPYRSRVGFDWSDGKDTHGNIYMNFTTSLSGSRVSSISRSEFYDDSAQPGLPEFLAALAAKYGPPSVDLKPKGFTHLMYIWYEGKLVQIGDEQWKRESRNGFPDPSPARCRDIYNWGGYVFQTERSEKYPGCTVVMDVTIMPGKRDTLISTLEVHLTDYQRWSDDNVVADAYLRAQMTEAAAAAEAAIKPAPTPAL